LLAELENQKAPLARTPTEAPVRPPQKEVQFNPAQDIRMPEVPPEPPQRRRKRSLANHIYSFTNEEAIMQQINAVVDDDRRDVGDILEIIPWGPIWTDRAKDWETLQDQLERLEAWRMILEQRMSHWQSQVQKIHLDSRFPLLEEKQSRSPAEWQAFLDELASKQLVENAALKTEVEQLEHKLKARSAAEARDV
jgi:hypothetical protein